MRRILLLLLLASLSLAQDTTEGGNVTQLNISGYAPSERWDGLFGEVASGMPANYSHVVLGNQGVEINMVALALNCTPPAAAMHILAVNDSWLTLPLSSGDLSVLDAFIGYALENGSRTFDETASLAFTYGSFANVPSLHTYTGASPSPFFQEYYLNDAAGNMVFVADIVMNRPDWNGTTSDYQIILPNNGSAVNYTVWVDVNYTCPLGEEPDEDKSHALSVDPPGAYEVPAGSAFSPAFMVSNPGDYTEYDIDVVLACPAGFACGSGFIGSLSIGDDSTVAIPITVGGPGEYVVTICAENTHTSDCKDFIVRVTAECVADADCTEDQYCDGYSCEDKRPPAEPCGEDEECLTGLCEDGICAYCAEHGDCAVDEYCSEGFCEPVECACGMVVDHTCLPYQCCADEDCADCSICTGNSCIALELEILVGGGEMYEGEDIRVQVVDNLGRGMAGATVFTTDMSATADGFGYVTVTIPYDGIIYASTSCAQAGLMLDIMRQGVFILPEEILVGEEVEIQLVDREGLPIAGAEVQADGKLYTTDGNGRFRVVFDEAGPKELKGKKPGYRIQDELTLVRSTGEIACYFPISIAWFAFYPLTIWQLWLLSIILAGASTWLVHRRKRARRWIWKLAYTLGPLILALPNYWVLAICFMSNIVLLQFIIELLLAIWRGICPPPTEDELGRGSIGPGKGPRAPLHPPDDFISSSGSRRKRRL